MLGVDDNKAETKTEKDEGRSTPGEACCLVLGHVAESSVLFWGIGFLFIDSLETCICHIL